MVTGVLVLETALESQVDGTKMASMDCFYVFL